MTKRVFRSNPLLSSVPPSPLKKKTMKTTTREKPLIMPPTSRRRAWSVNYKKRAVRSTMPMPSSYEMRLRTGKTAIKSKPATPPSPLSSSASCSVPSSSCFRRTQHHGFQEYLENINYDTFASPPPPSTPTVQAPNPDGLPFYTYDDNQEEEEEDDDELKSTADSRLRPVLVYVSSSSASPPPSGGFPRSYKLSCFRSNAATHPPRFCHVQDDYYVYPVVA